MIAARAPRCSLIGHSPCAARTPRCSRKATHPQVLDLIRLYKVRSPRWVPLHDTTRRKRRGALIHHREERFNVGFI